VESYYSYFYGRDSNGLAALSAPAQVRCSILALRSSPWGPGRVKTQRRMSFHTAWVMSRLMQCSKFFSRDRDANYRCGPRHWSAKCLHGGVGRRGANPRHHILFSVGLVRRLERNRQSKDYNMTARREKLGVKLVLIAGGLTVLLLLGYWYNDIHGPWGHTPSNPQSANEFFDAFMYLVYVTVFLPLGFPVVPWFFATASKIWSITIFMLFILFLLVPLFWLGCDISRCGQGAVIIISLVAVWTVVGLATLLSAAVAHIDRA
jgi:hypothetical protein